MLKKQTNEEKCLGLIQENPGIATHEIVQKLKIKKNYARALLWKMETKKKLIESKKRDSIGAKKYRITKRVLEVLEYLKKLDKEGKLRTDENGEVIVCLNCKRVITSEIEYKKEKDGYLCNPCADQERRIIAILKAHPEGITKQEILDRLKKGEAKKPKQPGSYL